jgi:hypothetical protein
MKKTMPGTASRHCGRSWEQGGTRPSVMSKVTRTSSSEFSESVERDARPGDAAVTTVVAPASLQRSNMQIVSAVDRGKPSSK